MLHRQNALVTGGTSGIGKEIALEFARNGASVAIFGTNEERAKKAIAEMKQEAQDSSQKFLYFIVDISSFEKINHAAAELLKDWGHLDILVNNAGITKDGLFLRMKEEDWDRVLQVNLKSMFNTCKAFSRAMVKARKGKIINVSSVVGLTGNVGQVNYAASKAGVIGFTKSLAQEFAALGKGEGSIQVNCIAPGYIQTPMTDVLPEAVKDAVLAKIPMKTLGKPEHIAKAALFLASNLSDYMTGQTLAVDGGMTMI